MKKVLEFFPFISAVSIWFGYVYFYSYYKNFNIEIYNYIDLSEFIIYVLNSTFYYSGSLYYIIILTLLNLSQYSFDQNSFNTFKENLNKLKQKNKLFFYFIINLPIILILTVNLIQTIINLIYQSSEYFSFFIIPSFSSLFILQLVIWIIYKYPTEVKKKFGFLAFAFVIISSFFIKNYQEEKSRLIKSKKIRTHQISFEYNGNQIISNNSLLFIGESKNFLFLYNVKTKETSIFNKSDIKYQKIKQ